MPKRKARKTRRAKLGKPVKKFTPSPEESIEDYLNKAEEDITIFSYESAIENCQNALRLDSKNVRALEMLASVLMETGDIRQAESLYKECIDISPEEGYSKYLSLGQIHDGKKSLEFYEKGIALLEKKIEDVENEQPEEAAASNRSNVLHRILSDALCSVSELYVTDLCDEEDAESNCEQIIQKSIKFDESNPESYQALANLRLIQGNAEEAKLQITKSISLWLPLVLEDNTSPEFEHSLPQYDSRIKCSEILIELEMYEEASQVLERLIDEDDKVFIVWYLLGWANYIHGEIYKGNSKYYLEKAKQVAVKYGCTNEEVLQHVDELLKELENLGDSDIEKAENEELASSSAESDSEMET